MTRSSLAPITGALIAGFLFVPAAMASVEVNLYDFRISRANGPVIFNDTFDDGAPPPAAPNFVFTGPASYAVLGSYTGSETPTSATVPDGYLRLNSALGESSIQPVVGSVVELQRARLNTNTGPADNGFGLKQLNTFVVDARFDLINPGPQLFSGYGIGLTDLVQGASGPVNNFVTLTVGGAASGPSLGFFYVDNADRLGGGIQFYSLGSVQLTQGGSIELRLAKNNGDASSPDNDLVRAFYRLNGAGDFLELLDSSATADARLFTEVGWTLAEFRAFQPIPEPSTYALMLAGLAGLAAAGRRKARR
jgi:hypothetical protein